MKNNRIIVLITITSLGLGTNSLAHGVKDDSLNAASNFSDATHTQSKVEMNSETADKERQRLVQHAKRDLAQRLAIGIDKIKLLEVRAVTWPDSSAGCAKPGQAYLQILQQGFLIRLRAGPKMYFYHNAGKQLPFLCEQSTNMVPKPKPGEEFIPPPGIDVK